MGSSGSRPSAPAADSTQTSRRLRKTKQNIFVPLLSCGTSSSWRTENSIQESPITPGDRLTHRISSGLCVAYDGQPGPCQLQNIGVRKNRESLDECSSDNVSTASYQSLSGSVESTDHTSSIIVDNASHSLPGQRHRYSQKATRQVISLARSQSSLDTHTSTDECLPNAYVSCPELSSNQSTSEGNEINDARSVVNTSRVEGASGCMPEQENSANSAEPGRPYYIQNSSSMEIYASSSRGTVSAASSDELSGLHNEASSRVAQVLDESRISRGELSGREARRNNGRRLWDALTRASSRRRRFSFPFMHADEDVDGSRTSNDDWGLFDWNSHELSNGYPYESGMLSRRSSNMEDGRWRSRPQVWALQHFSDSMGGSSGHSRHCAFGRHPYGRCSCEAFVMAEESSTRASISRIVMLAEALFEVLDEIHRQSVTLSRSTSLSIVSAPAPEAVVESFAVRIHKKADSSGAVLGQSAECYICLIEYEEGDHIRVLPCCHEFHMSCVDKWLKEAHRVCPLCRWNVCGEIGGT